jgi:hypothetical protein
MIHQIQSGQQTEIGQAVVPLNKILSAPLTQTPSAMVRVYDDYVDVKDPQTGHLKCNLRVLIYLEDNGVAKDSGRGQDNRGGASLQQARDQLKRNPAGAANPNLSSPDA